MDGTPGLQLQRRHMVLKAPTYLQTPSCVECCVLHALAPAAFALEFLWCSYSIDSGNPDLVHLCRHLVVYLLDQIQEVSCRVGRRWQFQIFSSTAWATHQGRLEGGRVSRAVSVCTLPRSELGLVAALSAWARRTVSMVPMLPESRANRGSCGVG